MGENIEIKDEKISRSKMKLYQDNIRWETTIDIHRIEIGRMTADMLLKKINGMEIESPCVDTGYELICRKSA